MMANTETTYLGLSLNSPLVVSSSGLNSSIERIKSYEANGAGAVVLKSLFEEQILNEVDKLSQYSDYTEAADYLKHYVTSNSLKEYIDFIKEAKAAVKIPVIASINCVSASQWVTFASRIQEAGADAIEINVFLLPTDAKKSANELEEIYYTLASKLTGLVSIPVSFKLGAHFTNPLNIIEQLYARKVKGVVLFNRFFEPDFDIENLKVIPAPIFSNAADIRNTLRWVGMTSHLVPKVDVSASTGVHDGESLIKMILAGASSVQVCSTIYKNGAGQIAAMLKTLSTWMDHKGYKKITDFKGAMNYGQLTDPTLYERSQFMKYYSNYE
ncbi:MAG TPA: dihydroorotate dehydrogenase-like protein [Tenuifilaceae bacterium]|nr:dihydroorotate dehydrogenase-like protein [Tenuifilaceae bacterium]